MVYNFDKVVDRKGTSTYKYEFCDFYFGSNDVLPLWVADMDFETPDFIMDVIKSRANHNVMGYTVPPKNFNSILKNWVERNHNWELSEDWIKFMPGVLPSIAAVLQVFSKPGENIIIQTPVYPPFISIPKSNGRRVLYNKLKRVGNTYEMDLDDFRMKAKEGASVFILSNPHNPAGVVFTKHELHSIAEICHEHGILVISDEIHCDLAHPGSEHIPFASVSKKAKENSITFMAPSKTFNIAGLGTSFCIVPNTKLRKQFYSYLNALHISHSNMFAYLATIEAFTKGDEWLKQLKVYLRNNFDFALNYFKAKMPLIQPFDSKASFLLWIDFSALALDSAGLKKLMVKEGQIGMYDGHDFGLGGEGFHRLNVGAPLTVVKDALQRIEKAVNKQIL